VEPETVQVLCAYIKQDSAKPSGHFKHNTTCDVANLEHC